jgi:hypothetical protein
VMSFANATNDVRLTESSNVVPSTNVFTSFIAFPPHEVPQGPY